MRANRGGAGILHAARAKPTSIHLNLQSPPTLRVTLETEMAHDTALIVGATGLVGGHCLKMLLAAEDYQRVIALTRRAMAVQHSRLTEMAVDFDTLDEIDPFPAADVFCALGTT